MPKSRLPLAALALALLALPGCGPTVEPPAADYREKYPIGVRAETVALALASEAAAADEAGRISAFATGYLDRGHGPLTIVAPRELPRLRDRLRAAGVPASSIRTIVAAPGTGEAVTLRYERHVAFTRPCEDWSGPAGHDPLNDVHSNFGCAMQSNFGAMVADPADLVRMRDATPTDTPNSNRVVRRYRAGEPPAAIPTPLQNSGAAGTTSTR